MSFSAVVAFVTSSSAVLGADLPVPVLVKAPAVAVYNWTGCHVGGHVGGAFTDDTATNRFGASRSHDSSGFVGGGQIGCDYQFAPGWVVGAEGRAAWTSLKESNAGHVIFPKQGVTVPSQFTVSNDLLTARLVFRVKYKTKDGDRQNAQVYSVELFP
jgi:outer membrane immunogenic protein